jgi:hypothetical protein
LETGPQNSSGPYPKAELPDTRSHMSKMSKPLPDKTDTQCRPLLWALLLSSLIGVSIWYVQRLAAAPLSQWGSQTVVTFSYFTTFTNLIAMTMAAALLAGRGKLSAWFGLPTVQAACCLYIAFVGLGFWFLLGGPVNIDPWYNWLPEITAHTLSPILGAIFWLRCVPKGHMAWRHAFLWLAYPIVYLLYWLVRGPLVGYYPYFFVDVNALGYAGVAAWSGALIVAFLFLGSLMWLIDRRQAPKEL